MNNSKQQKEIEAIYPLTYLQEGMLFHSIHSSDSDIYFEQFTCTISGSFNPYAFKAAWQEAVNRHSIFRTIFVWKNTEQMMQVVLKNAELPFNMLDWRDIDASRQKEKLENFLADDRKSGFKLNTAPLLRLALIRLSESEYQFVWSHHHLVMDAWSRSILLKDVFQIYNSICRSETIELDLPRPFRDYVLWLRGQDINKAEEFWKSYLEGFSDPTPLPYNAKSTAQSAAYGEEDTSLSPELSARLNEIAHEYKVTVSTILQCAWSVMLSLYSGENDVLFGVTTAGRPPEFEKIESMVGLFINTIPMRVVLKPGELIKHFLQRIQSEIVEVREFEFSSLVQINRLSEIPRGMALFNSLVVYENAPLDSSLTGQMKELKIQDIRTSSKTNYPLLLAALPGSRISVGIAYDTGTFESEKVRLMLTYLINIIDTIAFNPSMPVECISLLNEEEKKKIAFEFNKTYDPELKPELLHKMFEEKVSEYPNNVALVYEDETLTYRELNERANQLADYLISKKITNDTLAGIFIDRSVEMIIGILGILKSGAAYIPIDTRYPEDRVNYIINDSGLKYLITKEKYLLDFPLEKENVICLDRDKDKIADFSCQNPVIDESVENLAYVIYTSGSTGKPKGVMIPHKGLKNLLTNMVRDFKFTPESRVMQFTSIGFDASIVELFTSLTSGAALYIASKNTVMSPEKIAEFIRKNEITIINSLPTLLSLLPDENLPTLKTVISGGEACPWDIVKKWSKHQEFFNGYGPTEITVACSWGKYEADSALADSPFFPIGKPFGNINLYVLDRMLNPVPPGVSGEIFADGPGIARGYLNRPELTAEKFVPNPFSGHPGERLYKTGDIAKYLPDGRIEYVCRNDNQIKMRGFRIELSEIESQLMRYKDVQNAVVLVKKKDSGDSFLAAYLMSKEGKDENISEIRNYLSKQLPEYMIPSEYIWLESFPITHNGKIDKHLLLSINPQKEGITGRVRPVNPIEELLKVIWSEVLESPVTDAEANFFESGGHSLKVTQLLSRIRKVIGLDIPLNEFFKNPKISSLSEIIQKSREKGVRNLFDQAITRSPKRDSGVNEFEVSFSQQRLWFLEQLSPEMSTFHIPLALRLSGDLDQDALKMSLAKIIERHESMRTHFKCFEGKPFQLIDASTSAELVYKDLSSLNKEDAEHEIKRMASEELKSCFHLDEGPLFRFRLYRSDKDEHIFLAIMHHIISDGWSMTVFIQELAHYYNAFKCKKVTELPKLPVQYADFSEWQRGWLKDEVLRDQLNYWKEELDGANPLLEFPADFLRPPVQTPNGATEKFQIPKDVVESMKAFCLSEGVTPFMVLLSAFQIFLSRLSDKDDIVVGIPVANRTKVETEKMIGFFVNTLVMRYIFSGSPDFKEVVKTNREKTLQAFRHQDLPFEQIVEELHPERNLSYSPVFQIAFVYQNFTFNKFDLPGITASTYEVDSPLTKYDITLTIAEQADGLAAYWEYNTDLFKKQTIISRIEQFKNLLRNLLNDPKTSIRKAQVLSDKEKELIIGIWNKDDVSLTKEMCLHELIEKTALQYPDNPAVTYSSLSGENLVTREVTYSEVNARANRLANYIRKCGLKPETYCGLLIPRSIDLAVAVLAVLKAGGAFIPLDSSYPRERIEYILKDSKAEFLLTTEMLSERFPGFSGELILIDQCETQLENESSENLNNIVIPDNLAYVIYTSGSTGYPKGAMLTHRGIINISGAQQQAINIEPGRRILQFSSSGFDAFVWEFVMALTNGAALQMIAQESAVSVEDISKIISLSATEIITIPQSILARLPEKDEAGNDLLKGLKTVIVAGEKCPVELANAWSESVKFFNAYGPTETTICASILLCRKKYQNNLPIGRPILNYELYILDRFMNPVPSGVPGELYIGGIGLGRGYLNRPELTAEKFVPNPFTEEKGARLYRSGDLVKFAEDGNIEFIGRIDNQVKLHGLRIELGEIESALLEFPLVHQAAVRLLKDHSAEGRLAGYITSKNGEKIHKGEIRAFLRKRLPEYMIPSVFINLPGLPVTKSGKINYNALPGADVLRNEIEEKYIAPRNETEEKLARIGIELLKIEKMGINDNFFELGGHSLLVSRFTSKIRDVFSVEVSLRTIFEHPTIAEIAEILRHLQQEKNCTSGNNSSADESDGLHSIARGTDNLMDLLKELEELPENEVSKHLEGE